MAEESPWDVLPSVVAGTVGSLAQMATRVTGASKPRWVGLHGPGEINYVRSLKFSQRMFAVDEKQKKFLFIFHSDPSRRVLMDATLNMNIAPVSTPPPPAMADSAGAWEVQYPAFLRRDLPDADIARFGPAGASRANTLFLAVGADGSGILAVSIDQKPPVWRYSPGGVPGEIEPRKQNYSLRPVLELIETLAAHSQNPPGGPALRQPRTTGTTLMNSLEVVLNTHASASAALAPSAATLALPEWFQKYFALLDYRADLNLRLNAQSTPARNLKDEQYQVTASLRVDDPEQPLARITVNPPDWAVPRERQSKFFDALLSPDAQDYLSEVIASTLGITRHAVFGFIDSSRNQSTLLRCGRDGADATYMAVLNGMVDGKATGLLLSLTFTGDDNPEVDRSSPAAIARLDQVENTVISVQSTIAVNFFQLLRNIRGWAGLLG